MSLDNTSPPRTRAAGRRQAPGGAPHTTADQVVAIYLEASRGESHSERGPLPGPLEQRAFQMLCSWAEGDDALVAMVGPRLQKYRGWWILGEADDGSPVPREILHEVLIQMHDQMRARGLPDDIQSAGGILWQQAFWATETLIKGRGRISRVLPASRSGDDGPPSWEERAEARQRPERASLEDATPLEIQRLQADLEDCQGGLTHRVRAWLDDSLLGRTQPEIAKRHQVHHTTVGRALNKALETLVGCMKSKGWLGASSLTARELQKGADRSAGESPSSGEPGGP